MKKKPIVFLQSRRLYLRPVSLDDTLHLTLYANDPLVRKYLGNTYPASFIFEEEWIKKKTMELDEHNLVFAVVKKSGDKLLGVMGLHRINYVDGTATTGSMLGAKDEWNKGYATEAKMLILEYAFHTLNLRKIKSQAFAENLGSINHNKKCGYQIEGVLKLEAFRDGTYHDHVLLAVFRDEWERKFKKTKK